MVMVSEDAAPPSAVEDESVMEDDDYRPVQQTGSLRAAGAPRSLVPLQGSCETCLAAGAAAHEAGRLDYGSGVQLLVDVVGSEEEALQGAEDQGGRQGGLVLLCSTLM